MTQFEDDFKFVVWSSNELSFYGSPWYKHFPSALSAATFIHQKYTEYSKDVHYVYASKSSPLAPKDFEKVLNSIPKKTKVCMCGFCFKLASDN